MKKSPKSQPPKADPNFPTTPDLRVKDPRVIHAEIDHFRTKILELATRSPFKAAVVLSEWVGKPAKPASAPKKAA